MKLSELLKMHGDCELKDGFVNYIIPSKKGKIYSASDIINGQTFYYINSQGKVLKSEFDVQYAPHYDLIELGNAFWDEQSVQEELKRREVCHIVEKYSYKFSKEEWGNDDVIKWYAYYNHFIERIDYSRCHHFQCQQLFFKSKNDIQTAISEVGQGDFIKYFLEVDL